MMIENDTPEPLTVIDGDISKTLSHYVTHPDLELRERFGDVLLEIIKEQPSDKILEHIHDLIASLFIVAEDKSNRVKHNLVDKIPDIFQQCHEHACPELENYLYDRLLQILFESLHDVYLIQAQAFIGILCILDKGFINPKKIEEKFCPVIISLLPKDYNHAADPDSENVFKGAIMLLAVVSSEIGPEKTEEWFIDRFIDLCYCPVQSIQKSCIKSLPLISNVMGTSYTEAKLLDIFLALCNAENFVVRQECAEHIALMSIFCTPESRREKLSPAVIKLTLDDSKWVADSTFKTLGQFISTFADPPITGLGPCRSGAKMLNWADSDFKIEADSKLLANYEYYMRTFTEPDTPTNTCHSQFNDEALNCEEIAQKLFKNKENLYQQINDDSYLKKSCIPCVDVGGNTISYTSNVIRNPIASPSGRMEELVLDNNLSILQDGTDLNDLLTENLDKNASTDDIFSTIDKEKEDKNILNSNLDSNSLNENSRLVVNEQQPKCRKRSELYFKRNTPSDLSLIIKQAINAGQEKLNPPPPPVVRQVSNEDSSLSNTFDKVLKFIQNESESTNTISSPTKKEQSPNNKQQADYSAGDYQKVQEKDEEDEAFNEFKYWYISPELPIDSELIEKNEDCKVTTYPPIKSSSFSNLEQQGTVSELVMDLDNNLIEIMMDITSSVEQIAYRIDKSDNSSDSSAQSIGVTNNEQPGDLYEFHTLFRCKPIEDIKRDAQYDNDNFELMTSKFKPPIDYEQDVIPPQILKAFVTMILYEADREITCAYDFPAVALTLGRRNWHLLKGLLQYLCDYINWKVRKTIASQIDWLALILGREIATQDLLPMYLGFFKDLDEVKIEAIKKAASFLKVVDPSKRDEVLSNFGICLRIDSKTNWRIKEDLARQIFLLVKMCDSVVKVDSLLYLTSLTGLLLEDKICCIREMAADAMVEIFHISNAAMQEAVMKIFLLQEFGLSGSWRKRQTFLSVVYKLLLSNPPLVEPFHLVSDTVRRLSNDPVSNIRLLIAKILVQLIKLDANILNETNEYDVEVMKILRKLSQDVDRDIRDVINVNIPIAEKIGRIKSEIDNQIESTRNHGLNAFDMPLT